MHEQIEPGIFVVRYASDHDLEPARQPGLVADLRAASATGPVAVLFVVGPDVAHVDASVPAFWLRVTGDPELALVALAVASAHVAVRLATSAFAAANVLRGVHFRVKSFSAEADGVEWIREAVRERLAPSG